MKKLRLKFPLEPKCVFFKISGEKTEIFSDVQLTKKLSINEKSVDINVTVPDNISVIQVFNPGDDTESPIDGLYKILSIINDYSTDFKTFSIFFDDRNIQIPVKDGKVDYNSFIETFESLKQKDWILAISEVDNLVAGDLFWNFKID